jgi:L-ascorbate metabolism protein UlaG (beta-lactamase superfamily)
MQLQLIRNATMRLTYAGKTILTDPFLGAKHAYKPLAGREDNPTVDLPCPQEEVIAGVDMVIVSHLHNDHFDPAAQSALPKSILLFAQPEDESRLTTQMGFSFVIPVEYEINRQRIQIIRMPGSHGTDKWAKEFNPVSGFVLRAEGEPTVYWCGDTIWYGTVKEVIDRHQPDVIITHSGGAEIQDSGPIIMDAEQTIGVCKFAPKARVVAVHMEALDHCKLSRADLRAYAEKNGVKAEQLLIPADGETLTL